MRLRFAAMLLLLWMLGAAGLMAQPARLQPVRLTTNFRENATGVTGAPVLGWTLQLVDAANQARGLRQSAYRIRVAKAEAHRRGGGHKRGHWVWDSGRVAATTYWNRPYAGPPLEPGTPYVWQVQAWSGGEAPGPWSAPARFTTGLFQDSDWSARWIAAGPDRDAAPHSFAADPPPLPVFRHGFALRKPVREALLFASGMGQYEIRVNGKDVAGTVLNPGWTDYRKTVPYDIYDVTALLRRGRNAMAVLLGNGMYNVEDVKGHYTKFSGSYGQPKCLLQLQLRYADGSTERVVTDGTWQTHEGPVLYSSTFGGEVFDGGALPAGWDQPGFHDGEAWKPATVVDGPGGRLQPEQTSGMEIAQIYQPVRKTGPRAGVTVYDLGETMSGWPEIEVRGLAGAEVQMLPGELLNADGTVSQRSANAFPQNPVVFRYRLQGGAAEIWHPRFAYYSFRYVEVTTKAAPAGAELPQVLSLRSHFVHARVAQIGRFESSDALFGRIHRLIDRAVLSNLASVVTDCPSREKLGWLEQTYLNAATLMLNFDVTDLYEKMSDDMRDAQLASGLVPSIAPEYVAFRENGRDTAFRDSPEWGSAVVLSPWALFQFTGDRRPLERNYAAMQRYVAYLDGRAGGKLLDYGLGDWYDIGPREPGPSQLTSRKVTATGVFYEDLVTMGRIAAVLGHADEAQDYARRAAKLKEQFNRDLFHPETGQYDRGSQTANALPLALGLVPEDRVQTVLQHLVDDIHAHGDHVTAGDVGFHYVVRALTDFSRGDVLQAMFSRTDTPSYGFQLARGATTLTEAWDANPASSQNHFMLGHGEEWFYRGLAGLSVDMSLGAGDAITMRPSFLEGVSEAAASYRSAMGEVSLKWSHAGERWTVDAEVPPGGTAHLSLPGGRQWQKSNAPARNAAGVMSSQSSTKSLELTLGSGRYRFTGLPRNGP